MPTMHQRQRMHERPVRRSSEIIAGILGVVIAVIVAVAVLHLAVSIYKWMRPAEFQRASLCIRT